MGTLRNKWNVLSALMVLMISFWIRALGAADNPSGVQSVIDHSGNVVTIWSSVEDQKNIVQTSFQPAGGQWGPPLTISLPGYSSNSPHIAMDELGNAVAIWNSIDPVTHHIYVMASMKLSGSDWSNVVTISPQNKLVINNVELRANHSNQFIATWTSIDCNTGLKTMNGAKVVAGDRWITYDNICPSGL